VDASSLMAELAPAYVDDARRRTNGDDRALIDDAVATDCNRLTPARPAIGGAHKIYFGWLGGCHRLGIGIGCFGERCVGHIHISGGERLPDLPVARLIEREITRVRSGPWNVHRHRRFIQELSRRSGGDYRSAEVLNRVAVQDVIRISILFVV